jgi:hypothetical protein
MTNQGEEESNQIPRKMDLPPCTRTIRSILTGESNQPSLPNQNFEICTPWIPTFPPSFNHWINMSRLSWANRSRDWFACVLAWLNHEAVWSSLIPLLNEWMKIIGWNWIRMWWLRINSLLGFLSGSCSTQLADVEYLKRIEDENHQAKKTERTLTSYSSHYRVNMSLEKQFTKSIRTFK